MSVGLNGAFYVGVDVVFWLVFTSSTNIHAKLKDPMEPKQKQLQG